MKSFLGLEFVLLQLVCFLVAVSAQNALVATSDPVKVGQPLLIRCQSERPIDSCRFKILGFGTDIKLYSGVRHHKYTFVGDYDKGDCSISVNSASPSNHGTAQCWVTYPESDQMDEMEVDVQVLHPPEALNLISNGNFVYNESDQMHFNCASVGGYPPPTLTLQLDDEVLAQTNDSMALNHTGIANHSDCFKRVVCTADHPELGHPLQQEKNLIVNYAPLRGNYSVSGSGLKMSVSVHVLAYPKPYMVNWSSPKRHLQNGTYQEWEDELNKEDRGSYIYHLEVSHSTEETNLILLTVRNALGKLDFNFDITHAPSVASENPGISWIKCLIFASVVVLL